PTIGATLPDVEPPMPVGEVTVYRGDFFNLSITKAAEKLLRRAARPLKTPEIVDAFRRAEYRAENKNLRSNVFTALHRSPDFVKVLPDTWDLAEKYPEVAAAQREAAKQRKPRQHKSRKLKAKPKAGEP